MNSTLCRYAIVVFAAGTILLVSLGEIACLEGGTELLGKGLEHLFAGAVAQPVLFVLSNTLFGGQRVSHSLYLRVFRILPRNLLSTALYQVRGG